MDFREYLKNNIVYLDGGMGTLLQAKGLKPGEHPELWNISHPEIIKDIHKSYYDSGSNVVCTNTFGANTLKFSPDDLDKIIHDAIKNARTAAKESTSAQEKFVALDIGPSGKLLKPLGDLDFEEAVSIFAETVKLGVKYHVDLILIETMNDSYETKAALLAAKENSNLPIIVTNAYSADGKLMTGATPAAMVALLEGMGVDALGANCSLGPKQLASVCEELLQYASVPVILKPNAGLPRAVDGKTVFDVLPPEFSDEMLKLANKGLRVMGGCCGTTPEYILALTKKTRGISPTAIKEKKLTMVSSYTHAVIFGNEPILIGERINPTGKKRFKQALIENDIDYILTEGLNQQDKGVHILDVNVGLPEIDEVSMLSKAVYELQSVTDLPLQIDTSNVTAMETALRRYNGKAMINSVNGKISNMEKIFPFVKKYGGVVVALTLDESGIPETAEGRIKIAENIIKMAEKYGIDKKNIVFDTLAMSISAAKDSATATLKALNAIRNSFGCHTSLGVSNISFGLPNRDMINSTFFAMALENGLSAAIMNPYSADIMKTYYSYKALKAMDDNFAEYINISDRFISVPKAAVNDKTVNNYINESSSSELNIAIVKGLKDSAYEITKKKIIDTSPMDIVNKEIIPALNTVGEGFEKNKIYLPQLLMSAEAASSAFSVIKAAMSDVEKPVKKGIFIIATVHGDIHDIGKNIVKLLLENYGFNVIDLGKDVSPEAILSKTLELKAPIVGLSALMTTTVPSMEKTISLLKEKAPWCNIVVGGAVLTEEYAKKIGADKYAKDAMETVRYAESIIK